MNPILYVYLSIRDSTAATPRLSSRLPSIVSIKCDLEIFPSTKRCFGCGTLLLDYTAYKLVGWMSCIKGTVCHHEWELSDLLHCFRAYRFVQIISPLIKLGSSENVLWLPVGTCWILIIMGNGPMSHMRSRILMLTVAVSLIDLLNLISTAHIICVSYVRRVWKWSFWDPAPLHNVVYLIKGFLFQMLCMPSGRVVTYLLQLKCLGSERDLLLQICHLH